MKNIIAIIFLSALLFSCNNTTKENNKEEAIEEVYVPIIIEGLDISYVSDVFELFKSDIENDKLKEDYILVDYFRVLDEVVEGLNQNISTIDSSVNINSLSSDSPSEKAKDFEKSMNENGLSIQFSEGFMFFNYDPQFIGKQLTPYLSDTANVFLKLYLNEVENSCCNDASISISKEELFKRAYAWGDIFEANNGIWITKTAKSEYKKYLSLIFNGIDNSPAFDLKSKKFNPELIEMMNSNVEQFPNSKTSKFFTEYLELLKKENYKKTKAIESHIADIEKFIVV